MLFSTYPPPPAPGADFQRMLNGAGGHVFAQIGSSRWRLGVDWVQLHKSVQYTVGVVMAMCEDPPPELAGRADNAVILAILPGPKEGNVAATVLLHAVVRALETTSDNRRPIQASGVCRQPRRQLSLVKPK